MTKQQDLILEDKPAIQEPLKCLGLTFDSDDARRAHFTDALREKLADPEFRATPGFPAATDDAIVEMSDPPFYTACPNPFIEDFVRLHGKPYGPEGAYEREPFSVDVSEGKYDALYRAHPYHTKVPHLAIVPSILHYTNPGDIVVDGFCGSGMTGVAAQWCGTAPSDYRRKVEADWKIEGLTSPKWGHRRAILNDIGPAATFIAAGYNLPFDPRCFEREAERILAELDDEIGWMYDTLHTDGKTKGRINYTVWSEVFSCPECAGEVNFVAEALDQVTKKTRSSFPCPHCSAGLNKKRVERVFQTGTDPITGELWKRIRMVPVLINYNVDSNAHEKALDAADLEVLKRIEGMNSPPEVPGDAFPIERMYHGSRLKPKGFTRAHHLFFPRPAQALAVLWRKARTAADVRTRHMLQFAIEQIITTGSLLNRYRPGSSFGNGPLRGVYYVSSQIAEAAIPILMSGILRRLNRGFGKGIAAAHGNAMVSTGDCASLGVPERSVDYIFTDPPFGENIYYADLNFLVESWHGVRTTPANEAIVDKAKDKGVHEYQDLMRSCFVEYCRVLKPGRWMTVVFSNSSNGIWRAIQEAMGGAGFVVADVRTLDKKHGSYRQVTSSAVKQDLIISAYKPTAALEESFELGHATPDSAWAFVMEHLHNAPVFVGRANEGEVVVERTPQMLLDRMIAFHVQRGVSVPVSGPEFLKGLDQRFPKRDRMYFLAGQIAEYDRKRTTVGELRQLSLFVNDEASAIQWVRQQLHDKPRRRQDLVPEFMRELQAWAKHEQTVELREILQQNFLQYEGQGPVPSQIHSYLSSNFRDLRKLKNDDAQLIEKAVERWYVPDPNKQADVELKRSRELLKEFEEYKATKQRRLKLFRTEAVRAGFKEAWQSRDYGTIVKVAEKLPPAVLQEDATMLMYYDNALTRLGDE